MSFGTGEFPTVEAKVAFFQGHLRNMMPGVFVDPLPTLPKNLIANMDDLSEDTLSGVNPKYRFAYVVSTPQGELPNLPVSIGSKFTFSHLALIEYQGADWSLILSLFTDALGKKVPLSELGLDYRVVVTWSGQPRSFSDQLEVTVQNRTFYHCHTHDEVLKINKDCVTVNFGPATLPIPIFSQPISYYGSRFSRDTDDNTVNEKMSTFNPRGLKAIRRDGDHIEVLLGKDAHDSVLLPLRINPPLSQREEQSMQMYQ